MGKPQTLKISLIERGKNLLSEPERPKLWESELSGTDNPPSSVGPFHPPPIAPNNLRVFQSMRNPVYRLFWFAMMGQMGAMNMQMVARSWYVYELTRSATVLGLIGIANGIPMLAFSLFGGVIADQIQKKYILLAGQVASAVLAILIAGLITLGIINWEILLIASFFQGIVMALMMPARQAMIPEIVGQSGLTNAVALNVMGMNINRLLAPAVAGLLIALLGIDKVYYVMGGLYIVAVFFVSRIPRTSPMVLGGQGALKDLKNGIGYIKAHPILPGLLVLTLISVLFTMPYMMLLPMFTTDVITLEQNQLTWLLNLPLIGNSLGSFVDLLTDSAFRLGLLMTISGIGALGGSFAVAYMGQEKRGLAFLYSVLLTGGALLALSVSNWYFISLLIIIPVGFGQAARMALSNALVQAYTEDSYRGRVMSIYMMEFGITNFGVFGISLLAEVVGVQWSIGSISALMVIIGIYYLMFVRSIRNLD